MSAGQERMVRAAMAQPRVITDDPGVQVEQEPRCHKCGQSSGRIVEVNPPKPGKHMHAYGSCESLGEVTERAARTFGLEWPRPKSRSAAEVLDIPQVTAPLARVGDVIQHGQPIPDNVRVFRDSDGRPWTRSAIGHWHTSEDAVDACAMNECFEDSAWKMLSRYMPLTVVEVDPEPQPAVLAAPCLDASHDVDRALVARLLNITGVDKAVHLAAAVQNLVTAYRTANAESGPLVLSLPHVPDGAVALIFRQDPADPIRFTPVEGPLPWRMVDSTGAAHYWALLDLIAHFGPVEVVMREPRTWPKLDPAPDAPEMVEVDGHGRFIVAVRRSGEGMNQTTYIHEEDEATGGLTWTLGRLRELGEVREVLS